MTESLHRPLSADVADRFTRASQERAKALLGDEPVPEVILPTFDADRLREYVENSLKCLGNDPWTVAQTLKELGITGERWRAPSCPIAAYTSGLGKGIHHTLTSGSITYVYPASGSLDDVFGVLHPYPVAAFIEEFDDGLYEYLVVPHVD